MLLEGVETCVLLGNVKDAPGVGGSFSAGRWLARGSRPWLVPVAVLEALAAAAGTDVVAPDTSKGEALRPAERYEPAGGGSGRSHWRSRRVGAVLRPGRGGVARC